ncbi:hypothetical protein KDL01_11020 [Actinospica durhamensis]|uniref:Uncharacterized protein n=1 Tax=Actinospica durhamensis TaxID=1508375 RepID=A0A941EMM2_9ACTN|nr:hypothetical protein [Actinospica durhamensis]MBR7833800.1 hypothetical protein [Actinospica durhamensis]
MIGLVTRPAVRTRAERLSGYRRVLEARSPQTSVDRLRVLATDEVRPVRLWTARNPATPADALDRLARDCDASVRWNALVNPLLPDEALSWMAEREEGEHGSRWFHERSLIVHHPNASEGLRAELIAAGACRCPEWCSGRSTFAAR